MFRLSDGRTHGSKRKRCPDGPSKTPLLTEDMDRLNGAVDSLTDAFADLERIVAPNLGPDGRPSERDLGQEQCQSIVADCTVIQDQCGYLLSVCPAGPDSELPVYLKHLQNLCAHCSRYLADRPDFISDIVVYAVLPMRERVEGMLTDMLIGYFGELHKADGTDGRE